MKIIDKLAMLFAVTLPAVTFATQCPDTGVISDPEVFLWTDEGTHFSGTMEIVEANLSIGGESITTRVYRQEGGCDSIPGPTMHMTPGNKYVLKFRNKLPYEALEAAHNVFKDPNVSNLHTHGLHISGETPGDDVTRSFEGGAGGDFVYDILPDHMGGTFWYHAHHHGSTFLQVSGGAFGLIIIDDSADVIPASVASMTERPLVIGYLDPDVAGTGGDTLITGTLSPTWTVNGHVNGDLIMPPDTWQHFRILLADRDAIPDTVSIGSSCEVALLARDGVWRTEAPLVLASNSIKITGASRADLAVRCSSNSNISVGNIQVASILVQGTADAGPSPFDTSPPGPLWSAFRPEYLRDLRGDTVDNTETVRMDARTINGSRYDNDVPTFALSADGLQRWSLSGARNHPFHLHIYHVQIDGSCADYEDGEYYDVVANNCTILFDLDESTSSVYKGRTIMHCHILEHGDQGAMGWTDVLGGMLPPTFPGGFGYVDYFDPIIPGGSGFSINAGLNDAWYDPATDGQGFFITVFPDLGFITTAWFTYDTELPPVDASANLGDAGHRWLTAAGTYAGNQAVMNIDLTSNGIFDTPTDVQHTDPPGSDGTLILTFDSCNSGTVEYDIPSISMKGIVPIQRVAGDNIALCEALSAD